MTLNSISVLSQDLTPGSMKAEFVLNYQMIREVAGNLQKGTHVEIDGIEGTVLKTEFITHGQYEGNLSVSLWVREGIC